MNSPNQHDHHSLSGRGRRRLVIGLLVVLAAGGAAVETGLLNGLLPSKHAAGDRSVSGFSESPGKRSGSLTVKVIRPKRDPGLEIAVEQVASFEPYFEADLKTRVSGIVRSVAKDIGDPVRRGEVLIEIDVPELDQEVLQKEGGVDQRKQELRVAVVKHENSLTLVDVAKAGVRMQKSLVAQAEATKEFRRRRFARFQQMASRDTLVAGVVDEEEKEFHSATAAVESAQASVEKAEADLKEKQSSVTAALVDIDLKGTLVEVARRDLDRSRAVAAYARVTAPFDGVVVRRNVDPGAFVQNATSGASEPLLAVARTDLLTVVAKFPDNVAGFLEPGTRAVVRPDELPGVTIAARVTRYSPAIRTADRTVRVEVDLFNGTRAGYDGVVARILGRHLTPLGAGCSLGAATLEIAAGVADRGFRKGAADPLPMFAETGGGRILSGMTGTMRLQLGRFDDAHAVPSTVIYNRGGKPYILLVEKGRTKQVPVRVQVNDGTTAKVAILDRGADGRDVLRELTGAEQIVAGRQLEVGDGESVTPAPTDW